jgi:hypothetical protein
VSVPLGTALAVALAAAAVAQGGPSPSPSPAAPAPSATPAYRFVYRPTPSPVSTPFPLPNAPQIDEIDLNDSALVPPAPLHVRVLTSPAVVSVSAETFGRSIAIPQHERGVFTFDGYIPDVPGFLRNRTYDVDFIAADVDGRTASVTLPLTLK